jgi:hypothetical protein
MTEPKKQLTVIVIRADGTVPFDDDYHLDVRANALTWLMDQGHTVSPIHGTKHLKVHDWKPAHTPKA